MVVEKDGSSQLDQATWETVRGLVRLEVAAQAHLWSESLEKSQAQTNCQIQEFQGVMSSVDKEHSAALKDLDERLSHMDSKLAGLSVEVHKYGAASRGELRRASIELDGKITALGERDHSFTRELDSKIDRESQALREQQQNSTTELLMQIQDLQRQVIEDRGERQATQTRCMHYSDRQVAAAMSSKELEARFQIAHGVASELDQKLLQVEASVRSDQTRHSEELCTGLSSRMCEIEQLADRRDASMSVQMDQCAANARQAALSADKAVRIVDESLHEKVHTASRNLVEQIEAAAARSAAAPQGDSEQSAQAAEQHSAKRAQELQAGFYSLVAREALDTEIRALVDRATRRLQTIADDLAQRSTTIQDHVVAAEEQLHSSLEFVYRQVAEIEAQKLGHSPPSVQQ